MSEDLIERLLALTQSSAITLSVPELQAALRSMNAAIAEKDREIQELNTAIRLLNERREWQAYDIGNAQLCKKVLDLGLIAGKAEADNERLRQLLQQALAILETANSPDELTVARRAEEEQQERRHDE